MTTPIAWEDKHPEEIHLKGVDWRKVMGEHTIVGQPTAVCMSGTVVLNHPYTSYMVEGIQAVWVSGGTPGVQRVRCQIRLSDGQLLQQDMTFNVVS